MSRWILLLLGFQAFSGAFLLQAQLPQPPKLSYPAFPNAGQPSTSRPNFPTQVQTLQAQPVNNQPETQQPVTITAQTMEQLDDTRKVSVGDRLSFQVLQDRDAAIPLGVTEMGEVQFPLVGRLKAAGKTLKQLAYEVKGLMDRDFYYNSTVLIGLDATSKFRGRIYVIGAVNGVGPQDIPSDEVFTVSKAILRAGGFGDFANQRKVKLVRKGAPGGTAPVAATPDKDDGKKDEIIVDCKAIYEGDTKAVDPVLQPDDMIVVPQRLINF